MTTFRQRLNAAGINIGNQQWVCMLIDCAGNLGSVLGHALLAVHKKVDGANRLCIFHLRGDRGESCPGAHSIQNSRAPVQCYRFMNRIPNGAGNNYRNRDNRGYNHNLFPTLGEFNALGGNPIDQCEATNILICNDNRQMGRLFGSCESQHVNGRTKPFSLLLGTMNFNLFGFMKNRLNCITWVYNELRIINVGFTTGLYLASFVSPKLGPSDLIGGQLAFGANVSNKTNVA